MSGSESEGSDGYEHPGFSLAAEIRDRVTKASKTRAKETGEGRGGEGGGERGWCRLYTSLATNLNVVISRVLSDSLYGNVVILTPSESDLPLAASLQQLVMSCPSENFAQASFVTRASKAVDGGFVGTSVHPDKTVYTLTAETVKGFCALLYPLLDAIFLPQVQASELKKIVNRHKAGGKSGRKSNWEHEPSCLEEESASYTDKLLQDLQRTIYSSRCAYHYSANNMRQVDKVTLKELREYHLKHYRPSNCYVILAGPIAETDVELVLQCIQSFEEENLDPAILKGLGADHPQPYLPTETPRLRQPDLQKAAETELLRLTTMRKAGSTVGKPGSTVGSLPRVPLTRYSSTLMDNSFHLDIPRAITTHNRGLSAALTAEPMAGADMDLSLTVNFIFQGPDFASYLEFQAARLLAEYVQQSYNTKYAEPLSAGAAGVPSTASDADTASSTAGAAIGLQLSWFDRKYPLIIFSQHCGELEQATKARSRFCRLLSRLALPNARADALTVKQAFKEYRTGRGKEGDGGKEGEGSKEGEKGRAKDRGKDSDLLASGFYHVVQQNQRTAHEEHLWRSDFDVVSKQAIWSSCCDLRDLPLALQTLESCFFGVEEELLSMPLSRFREVLRLHFSDPVTVLKVVDIAASDLPMNNELDGFHAQNSPDALGDEFACDINDCFAGKDKEREGEGGEGGDGGDGGERGFGLGLTRLTSTRVDVNKLGSCKEIESWSLIDPDVKDYLQTIGLT